MKKIIALIMSAALVCSMASCGGQTVTTGEKEVTVSTIEELEGVIEKDVTDTVAGLRAEYEQLISEVDTFDKYIDNTDKVNKFYDKISDENRAICIRMREYSIAYAELVLNEEGSSSDKLDDIEGIFDFIYDDAMDDIYDGIYDELMDDMYDEYYAGMISDGYDDVAYKVWSDISSDAYEIWSDKQSDLYDEMSDAGSDIYDFWSDVSDDLWDEDADKVNEEIAKFREDIDKLKAE